MTKIRIRNSPYDLVERIGLIGALALGTGIVLALAILYVHPYF